MTKWHYKENDVVLNKPIPFSICAFQANQSTAPQPIELRVRCLRATRDKLPRGLYAVSVALHSRLGGPAVAWCGERSQHQCAVSTEPVEHHGRYYNTDLHVNQSLHMVRLFVLVVHKSRKHYLKKKKGIIL